MVTGLSGLMVVALAKTLHSSMVALAVMNVHCTEVTGVNPDMYSLMAVVVVMGIQSSKEASEIMRVPSPWLLGWSLMFVA